jgi:hypothetical protein
MNGPIWLGWALVILLVTLSIILLMGKGSFLIAGYNTASKEEKEKYNVKRLCRIMGGGLSLIAIITAIDVYFKGDLPKYLQWIMPWGLLGVIAAMLILSNTICRKREGKSITDKIIK